MLNHKILATFFRSIGITGSAYPLTRVKRQELCCKVELYVVVYFCYNSVSMLLVQVDVLIYSILIIFAIFRLSSVGILTFKCYCSRWPPH
jgi:hypothetical protein